MVYHMIFNYRLHRSFKLNEDLALSLLDDVNKCAFKIRCTAQLQVLNALNETTGGLQPIRSSWTNLLLGNMMYMKP